MTGNKLYKMLVCAALLTGALVVRAEDGGSYSGFTPYSMFGLGNISAGGSAYNNTMGGVGIASRNNRFINSMNPAAVTARDSLSFMSDVSLSQMNTIFRQGTMTSAANVFNMNNFIISTPIAGKLAMMAGVKPFSTTGYGYGYYDYDAELGSIANNYSGQGSLYQLFVAAGYPIVGGLNLGVEYIHYFGNIEKTYTQGIADEAALGISKNEDMYIRSNSAKFGLQYEQRIGKKWKLCAGATYRLSSNISGYLTTTSGAGTSSVTTVVDTLSLRAEPLKIASELGLGIAVNYMNRLRAEIDYTRADWSNTGYYRRLIAYRMGAYINRENCIVNGSPVISRGITLGATLPVFRWYNGVTLGLEVGQRGTLKNNLIRETYVGFSFGVNLFDIWFQKHQYD